MKTIEQLLQALAENNLVGRRQIQKVLKSKRNLSVGFGKLVTQLKQPEKQPEKQTEKLSAGDVLILTTGKKYDGHEVFFRALQQSELGEPSLVFVEENPWKSVLEKNGLTHKSFEQRLPAETALLQVDNARPILSHLAAQFFEEPTLGMVVFGITGTNGKTSTSFLLHHILERCGFPTGLIGTVEQKFREHTWPASLTTPSSTELQERFSQMKGLGARAAVLEVSSHALDQHRADDVHFNSVCWTNFTRDHLDYHSSLEEYFAAKQRLLTDVLWKSKKRLRFVVVNRDDPTTGKLQVAMPAQVWSFGMKPNSDFQGQILKGDTDGTDLRIISPIGIAEARLSIVGEHAVLNILAAVAMAATVGIPTEKSLKALVDFEGVPGRLQRVPTRKAKVFVDYAHTPDALMQVCRTLKRFLVSPEARLIVVFGCAGDRDRGKRPLMAKACEAFADQVFVTSDNPRSEDPAQIMAEVSSGFSRIKPSLHVDRGVAIREALNIAGKNDIVLIAGKGHESTQEILGQKFPFQDQSVIADVNREWSNLHPS